MIDLEAIRARNEEFADCEDPSHQAPDGTITHRIGKADVDALLAEIERLLNDIAEIPDPADLERERVEHDSKKCICWENGVRQLQLACPYVARRLNPEYMKDYPFPERLRLKALAAERKSSAR